jgi:hypothetical protein
VDVGCVVILQQTITNAETECHCFRVYDNELNNLVVKEEDDDAVSLPGRDTEAEIEEQNQYCSDSLMHQGRGLDNGDAKGIDMETQLSLVG